MLPSRTSLACAIVGPALAACGALVALALEPALLAALAVMLLVRICWLDECIFSDLPGRDRLPVGYINTGRRRQRLAWRVLRLRPERDTADISPPLLASAMTAQAEGLWAFGLAAGAMHVAGWGGATGAIAAACLLAVSLQRAVRLERALRHVSADTPLPEHVAGHRGPMRSARPQRQARPPR